MMQRYTMTLDITGIKQCYAKLMIETESLISL